MLPFDLDIENKDRNFKLGNLEIPSYGSFTPKESKLLDDAEVNNDLPTSFWYVDALAIFLVSRCAYSLEAAKDALLNLPAHLLEEGFDWIRKEGNRWRPEEPDAEEAKKPETPTGQESIGDSSSDTPTSLDSTPEISETAQST